MFQHEIKKIPLTIDENCSARAQGKLSTGATPSEFLIVCRIGDTALIPSNNQPVLLPANQKDLPWEFTIHFYTDVNRKVFARIGGTVYMWALAAVFGGPVEGAVCSQGEVIEVTLTAQFSTDDATVACN